MFGKVAITPYMTVPYRRWLGVFPTPSVRYCSVENPILVHRIEIVITAPIDLLELYLTGFSNIMGHVRASYYYFKLNTTHNLLIGAKPINYENLESR